jgi:hypothetical protein
LFIIIKEGITLALDKDSLIDLICNHCEFYKESERELECGAFKILRELLEKGVIAPEEIKDVLPK